MLSYQRTVIFIFASLMLFIMQACAKVEAGDQSDFIAKAKQATIKYELTTRPIECLIYEVLDKKNKGKIVVDVREKHGGKCGGDPSTSPRAFSVAFDESTGKVWSDANSLLGQLEKMGRDR